MRTVAGAIVRNVGTRVFWVQTGGFDTHAQQGLGGAGSYGNLMGTYGDGVAAFYNDLRNQGALDDTLILQFSEFGRRISENGSQGTDHGAGAIMMAMGGAVRGGIYGTAASLDPNPANPDAREQRRRRAARNRLPSVVRASAGRLARRELDRDSRRGLQERRASNRVARSSIQNSEVQNSETALRPIIRPLGLHSRNAPRRLRDHRANRRRWNGPGLSGDGHKTEAPGRDQGPPDRRSRRPLTGSRAFGWKQNSSRP